MPEDIHSYDEFFGPGRELYNLKLHMEKTLKIEPEIKTSHLGNLPFTSFKPSHRCNVSFKDLRNSLFMRAALRENRLAVKDFYKFLKDICDADFYYGMLMSSDGDALRVIALLITAAEKIRITHQQRRTYYHKLSTVLNELSINTKLSYAPSDYHVKNRNNNKVDKQIYTWITGVNIIYKELSCYLKLQDQKICNIKQGSKANDDNSGQHISPTQLCEVDISGQYHHLLIEFFSNSKHSNYLSADKIITDSVLYNSVPITKKLLKDLENFTFRLESSQYRELYSRNIDNNSKKK